MVAKQRLSPADWIKTGLTALETQGPGALRAESLARDLGTTKGSFYWHFADVPAFQTALLEEWTAHANDHLFARTEEAETFSEALRALTGGIVEDRSDSYRLAEPAIRAWALTSEEATAAVRQIDAERQSVIAAILDRVGVSNPEIGQIVLAAANGMPPETKGDPIGTLVDLVVALR